MTTSRILLAIALLTALAACEIGGGETRTGAAAACFPVAAACAQNSDCCSYGCLSGICVANPAEGGACRTTDDCASPRLCKSGACTAAAAATCRDTADVCTSYLQCCSGNCEGAACTQNHAPLARGRPGKSNPRCVSDTNRTRTSHPPENSPEMSVRERRRHA